MDGTAKLLVVDGSRVVRATLRKRLSDHYTIVEESDGESAWQTLMLDDGIVAVISGAHPPRLAAFDLLARLRSSSKRRLHRLPFLLIVSDVEHHEHRERDLAAGVADFITKTMKEDAILAILARCIAPETPPKRAPGGVLSGEAFARQIDGFKGRGPFSAIVFTVDGRDALLKRFGETVLSRIDARLGELLVARLGPDDLLGHWHPGRLAVLARGVTGAEGAHFARQICRSLAAGQIAVRGENVPLTLSAGVADSSADGKNDAKALLAVAAERLAAAAVGGGNAVIDAPEWPSEAWATVSHWLGGEVDRERILRLAPNLYPLLAALDRELALGLPLAEIKRRLHQDLPRV